MNAVIRVPLPLLEAQFLKMNARLLAAGRRAALEAAARGQALMVARTDAAPPASPNGSVGATDTGRYRMGWSVEPTHDGARLYNPVLYAPVIESGRAAGERMPPRDVIARWAKRKMGLSSKEAKRAAFVIARAIAKRGLRPRKVMTGGLSRMGAFFRDAVARQIALVMAKGPLEP